MASLRVFEKNGLLDIIKIIPSALSSYLPLFLRALTLIERDHRSQQTSYQLWNSAVRAAVAGARFGNSTCLHLISKRFNPRVPSLPTLFAFVNFLLDPGVPGPIFNMSDSLSE